MTLFILPSEAARSSRVAAFHSNYVGFQAKNDFNFCLHSLIHHPIQHAACIRLKGFCFRCCCCQLQKPGFRSLWKQLSCFSWSWTRVWQKERQTGQRSLLWELDSQSMKAYQNNKLSIKVKSRHSKWAPALICPRLSMLWSLRRQIKDYTNHLHHHHHHYLW